MQENNSRPAADTGDTASLHDYAERMLAQRLKKMLSFVDEVRNSADSEAVHKMRVASRRARVALDVFHICSKDTDDARLERQIKRVTDALSQARDLDVMQETLVKVLGGLPPEQRSGVEGFIKQLQKRRKVRQRSVVKTLKRLDDHAFKARFDAVGAAKGSNARVLHGVSGKGLKEKRQRADG